jgi:hypothetical protein
MFSTRTLPRAHFDTWTRVFYSSPLKMYGNGLKIEPINIMCFVLKGIYIFTDQIYIKEVCFNVYIYFFLKYGLYPWNEQIFCWLDFLFWSMT